MSNTFNRNLFAQQAGLKNIYCAETGEHVGVLTNDEFDAFIEMEDSIHAFDSDEDFLDHLSLAMMAINSRPSPLFQNMTPTRYRLIAEQHPARMFRYLCGKLVFERWNHINGHVNHGGKTEWLKTIELGNADISETLKTLIRLDGILSIRKVFFSAAMMLKLEKIREEWPGFPLMAKFIEELETQNIEALATHDQFTSGKVAGNSMARQAVLSQISDIDMEEFEKAYAQRQAADILRKAYAENRVREAKKRIDRHYAPILGNGESIIKHGVEAIMDYAFLGGTLDKDVALKLVSKMDTTKISAREKTRVMDKITNTKKKPSREPRVAFDIDFSGF